jgi:hypothetical protein
MRASVTPTQPFYSTAEKMAELNSSNVQAGVNLLHIITDLHLQCVWFIDKTRRDVYQWGCHS